MAILSLQTPNPIPAITTTTKHLFPFTSRRTLFLQTPFLSIAIALIPQAPLLHSSAQVSPSKPLLSAIENTKSWFQFYGDGFAIRVPPDFQDIMEPEDFNAGLSLYGDKVKPKTFAARFASPDGYFD